MNYGIKKGAISSYLIVLFIISISIVAEPQADFDQLPKLKADSILEKTSVQGTNYQIKDPVLGDGYGYEFTIESQFGSFTARSQTQLLIRLHEIDAIAQLKEITGGEAFAKAAGETATHSLEATANFVQNPVETAKGIPGGVKRKFENIGRFVKRSTDNDEDEDEENDSSASDATKQVLGVNSALRRWAQKVEVDPYSSNVVLQQELQRLAKYDSAGKFATNIVRPKVQPLGTTSKVNDLVWGNDPQALMKINEQRLQAMGVDPELSKKFLNHKVLTLTDQTFILSSLDELKQAEGRAEFIRSTLTAESEEEAFLYRDSASILEKMQSKGTTISQFLPSPRIAVVQSGKRFVAVLPADGLYWTQSFATAVEEFTKRHKNSFQNSESKEIWLSGAASERARSQLVKKGWKIHENLLHSTNAASE